MAPRLQPSRRASLPTRKLQAISYLRKHETDFSVCVIQRHSQLIQKGENPDTISYLADDACTWIDFRTALRNQVRVAKAFVEEYHLRYINDKELQCMQDAIGKLSDDVESRLNALDQTVRDLLQFVSSTTATQNFGERHDRD